MKILFAAAEVAPFAKVGGLADVAGSLPKALTQSGHDVRVVMPAYPMVLSELGVREPSVTSRVQVNPFLTVEARLYEVKAEGLDLWLVGVADAFAMVTRSEQIYAPTRDAYLAFTQAVLAFADHVGWKPEIVHAHDWHMGFLPVMMREGNQEAWQDVGSVFTIHNLAYQGEFGPDTLDAVGLPQCLFDMHRLETYGAVNFLKSGCVYADQVNTVSPSYAEEIQTPQYGCRLEGLMAWLASEGRLRGILNGIDREFFDPATDPAIAQHFSADDKLGKQTCREALVAEMGLEPSDGPIFGVVSRLSDQKGFDLILAGLDGLVARGGRLVVLGTGDPLAAEQLRAWQKRSPGKVGFAERFDADLAQRIYAGCDVFLMPSSFEPCGLGQMIAMRYGSIPLVRKTGGLSDTVEEGRNGFVFEERSVDAYRSAVARAFDAFENREDWLSLVDRAMREDFGWERSATQYVALYEDALRHARNAGPCESGCSSA